MSSCLLFVKLCLLNSYVLELLKNNASWSTEYLNSQPIKIKVTH